MDKKEIKKDDRTFIGIAKEGLVKGSNLEFKRLADGRWVSDQLNLTESFANKLEKKYQSKLKEVKQNGKHRRIRKLSK